jgi:transcriptional regulator with XRE-family HTH domain
MPARTPPVDVTTAEQLERLGQRIRAHRKRHKVSATTTAEAAGMSRVTLQRIERGEPSVTMGAYLSALTALGLELDVTDPAARSAAPADTTPLPPSIRLADYPELERLAWQIQAAQITPAEALDLYERNWRHVDVERMAPHERALVDVLARTFRGGRLLV